MKASAAAASATTTSAGCRGIGRNACHRNGDACQKRKSNFARHGTTSFVFVSVISIISISVGACRCNLNYTL
ncbi:MAG: hypothetical protein P4L80_17045 [Xanthobacteraceae bacterium]|nr:hypothetical protein [Xanthobacteraceae bacterium]